MAYFGIIFFQNKDHFLNPDKKVFDKERIIDLLNKKGIALYDTASAVRRLQDNASDKFLEVVEQTDISLLLKQIPMCKAIVTTGQKATDIIREQIKVKEPVVGTSEPSNSKTGQCDYTECLHPAVPTVAH